MKDAKAISLRGHLEHLLERFKGDTIMGAGDPALVQEIRLALAEEFIVLISQYSEEDLQKAVLMTFDESKRLPIHLACDKNAPLSILQFLLSADVDKLSITVPDKWGDLPLHTACSRHQTEVVKLLVDSDISKNTFSTKADNGSLPLHVAARYGASASVITLLLESNESRSTLLEPDVYGQLPLHAACRNGARPDVVALLLEYDEDKKTLLQEDTVGRLPAHLALLHTSENQVEVLQLLLQGMLCNRMENKGLDLWKAGMKSLLKSMQTHERNFTTRDKLDMISETIREFMERVSALELAVWRASCLQFDERFSSMQKSGADIIVRDVIPFLENEPVEDLIQKFRDY